MPAIAAYNTTVKIGGTSTAMVAQACSGSGTGWQVTDTAKRVLDPSVTPTWYDNAVAISSSQIASVNYLTGAVVFTVSKTGPITVSASYIPLLTIGLAHAATVPVTSDALDVSVFGSQWRNFKQGLKSLEISLETYHLPSDDLDPGAGSRTFWDVFNNDTRVLLEIDYGGVGAGYRTRSWGYLTTSDSSPAVDGIVPTNVDFKATSVKAADGSWVSVTLSA